MKNVIDRAAIEGLDDIDLLKFKPVVVAQVLEIRQLSGQEIIRCHHRVAFCQQRVAQMRAQESGSSGYQGALRVHDFLIFLVGAGSRTCGNSRVAARRPTL